MKLQLLSQYRSANCCYLCYDENNTPIRLTLKDIPNKRIFIPDESVEKNMILNKSYNYYKNKLSKYGDVYIKTNSRYEVLGDIFPVLYTNSIDRIEYKEIRSIGYVEYPIRYSQMFLEEIGCSPSGTLSFYKDKPKCTSYRAEISCNISRKTDNGYVVFDKGEYNHIPPVVTFFDFETHSSIKRNFATVYREDSMVYMISLYTKGKTGIVISMNHKKGIKLMHRDGRFETKEYPDNIYEYVKDNIHGDLYGIIINIEWDDKQLMWMLMSYVINEYKTNILSGWNISGFDNYYIVADCPQPILNRSFALQYNDYTHNKSRIVHGFKDFASKLNLKFYNYITNDMMLAYGAIKNTTKLSLKHACKTLGVVDAKIDMSYEEIGRITRYNHYKWLLDKCKTVADLRCYVPSCTSKDVDIQKYLSCIMLIKGDKENDTYLDRYVDVERYSLLDVISPNEIMEKIDYIRWLFVNCDQSHIWLDEKINRGVSHVLYTYYNSIGITKNLFISSSKEQTYKTGGGYVAPIVKFRLKQGIVSDLDVNSMYPSLMKIYNISMGTVFDNKNIVESIEDQTGVKFKHIDMEYIDKSVVLYLSTNTKIYFKDLEDQQPRTMCDVTKKSIVRTFKCLQSIDILGFNIQVYPFCMIGGVLENTKYYKRGSFFSGDIYGSTTNNIETVDSLVKHMMNNYKNYIESNDKPDYFVINLEKIKHKKTTSVYVKSISIYTKQDELMAELYIRKRRPNTKIHANASFVYTRDVWYDGMESVALLPYSQRFLGDTRAKYKSMMKPLKKQKEKAARGDAEPLTQEQSNLLMELDQKQKATKVLMNSEYGALNTSGTKSNNPTAGALITSMGRKLIVDVYNALRMFGGYITSGDTDSAMACYPFVDINKISENHTGSQHWSEDLKSSIVKLGNMHLKNVGNKLELGADGIFILFMTIAKKNYVRMDVCSLEFEAIGVPFIKDGNSKIYNDMGIDILKTYADPRNTKSCKEIYDEVTKRLDVYFNKEQYNKYKSISYKTEEPPPFVEIKRKFKSINVRRAIELSKKYGFDPIQTGQVWLVKSGDTSIDFRAMSRMSYMFYMGIRKSLEKKLIEYLSKKAGVL